MQIQMFPDQKKCRFYVRTVMVSRRLLPIRDLQYACATPAAGTSLGDYYFSGTHAEKTLQVQGIAEVI
jgi:hypothetical protein